jgi:hypothetical protein
MDKILKIKDEYISKSISFNIKGNIVKIRQGMSEKSMNYLFDNGYSEYFDVVKAVSLIDESIWVENKVEIVEPIVTGLIDLTVTPKLKKKLVDVKKDNNANI